MFSISITAMNNWVKSPWFVTTIYSLCNGRGFDQMAQGKIPYCIINSDLLVRAKGAILSLSHVEVLTSYKRELVDIEHRSLHMISLFN